MKKKPYTKQTYKEKLAQVSKSNKKKKKGCGCGKKKTRS